MRFGARDCVALLVGVCGLAAQSAQGQTYGGYVTQAGGTQPVGRYEKKSGLNNPAINFYGGARQASYAQQSQIQMPGPVPVQTAPPSKPFAGFYQQPSISPYLALDVRENDSAIPNYYMYVRPAQDQSRLNQAQQLQNRRVQQQVRRATAGGAVVTANGGIPTTGHSAQFMNIGGYYPGQR